MAMRRIQATISGRVQGVSFRYYTQREAQHLQLTGWVGNQPDGSVMTIAEGSEAALQRFVQFLHQGPPAARISHVTLLWQEASGEFSQFEIRYFYQ